MRQYILKTLICDIFKNNNKYFDHELISREFVFRLTAFLFNFSDIYKMLVWISSIYDVLSVYIILNLNRNFKTMVMSKNLQLTFFVVDGFNGQSS